MPKFFEYLIIRFGCRKLVRTGLHNAQHCTAPSATLHRALHSAQHYTVPSATQGRIQHRQQSRSLGWPPTAVC